MQSEEASRTDGPMGDDDGKLSGMQRVTAICDRFVAAWKAGQGPRIEDYLGQCGQGERADLLRQLLQLELHYRPGLDQAAAAEYIARMPAHEPQIRQFSSGLPSSPPAAAPDKSRPPADRNLLVGVLALQLDFISRDQLLAAMHAWILDKTQPLEDILLAQQALPPDARPLLAALLEKYLEKHGHDPQRGLAAVSSLGTARKTLESLADPDVQASLGHVAAARRDDDPGATQSLSMGQATSAGQRFRILRPHAQGGLGEVFVARDEELPRDVALKQIQQYHADDPDSRARFLMEAEITGGLEHPGIVPVYGLGSYADGRPFYAMRFIRGGSLKDAIEQFHGARSADRGARQEERPGNPLRAGSFDTGPRALEFRGLLRRFTDVCQAIEYAHSRGVLHRDLKPGNIMLGKYGETLVVDWGLAKPVGRDETSRRLDDETTLRPSSGSGSAPTEMGMVVGTPGFMSPEQAAGRLDLLGPASDVYSLGATLYALLTGQPAFFKADVLLKVQAGEFLPPRAARPGVPRPLEAICLKAMAREPVERYATPRLLAEDIERWLADEPVSAWREVVSQRARRWLKRHRTLATSALAAMLVGVAALGVVAVVVYQANGRLRRANAAERKAKTEAQRNFRLARRGMSNYLQISEKELFGLSGTQHVREALLEHAKLYAKELEGRGPRDASLAAESAMLAFYTGRIQESLRRFKEALDSYGEARKAQERLVKDSPRDANHLAALSTTANAIGRVRSQQHNWKNALQAYRDAEALRVKLTELDPDNAEYQRLGASAMMNIGVVYSARNELVAARKQLVRAQEIRKGGLELELSPQAELALRRDIAKGRYHLADLALLEYSRSRDQALKRVTAQGGQTDLDLAIHTFQEPDQQSGVGGETPDDNRYHLALCHQLQGKLEVAIEGERRKVADYFNKALRVVQSLAETNPAIGKYQHRLAQLYMDLGMVLVDAWSEDLSLTKYRDDGMRYLDSARRILDALTKADSEIPDYHRDFGILWLNYATIQIKSNQIPRAREMLASAKAALETACELDPHNSAYQKEKRETEQRIKELGP